MQLEKANYNIYRMSRLLQVSRSGCYKWAKVQATRGRGENSRQKFLDKLDKDIHDIWEDSDELYGGQRITAELVERVTLFKRQPVAKQSCLWALKVSHLGRLLQ